MQFLSKSVIICYAIAICLNVIFLYHCHLVTIILPKCFPILRPFLPLFLAAHLSSKILKLLLIDKLQNYGCFKRIKIIFELEKQKNAKNCFKNLQKIDRIESHTFKSAFYYLLRASSYQCFTA